METLDPVAARVVAVIQPLVQAAQLYLENVEVARVGGRRVVQIVVDLPAGPGGVDLDTVSQLSREISAQLDNADLIEGAYSLEVSTPGISRPLTQARHFSRAVGRLVRVETAKDTVVGYLEHLEDDYLGLRVGEDLQRVARRDITLARVEPDFRR